MATFYADLEHRAGGKHRLMKIEGCSVDRAKDRLEATLAHRCPSIGGAMFTTNAKWMVDDAGRFKDFWD